MIYLIIIFSLAITPAISWADTTIEGTTPLVFTSSGAVKVSEGRANAFFRAVASSRTNKIIEYSISGGDANSLKIDSASGEIQFINPPDFEVPTDSNKNNLYYFSVTASDGVNSTTGYVGVRVTDVDERPTLHSQYSDMHLVTPDGITLWYNSPSSIYFAGIYRRTYYTYTNTKSQVIIRYYDHDTEKFSPETIIDSLEKRSDDHLSPSIHIGVDGHINVAYSHHTSELFILRSTAAEDIKTLEHVTSYPGYYTYPAFIDDGRSLKLFFRQGIGGAGQPKGMYNFIEIDEEKKWLEPHSAIAFENPWFVYGFPPNVDNGDIFIPYYFFDTTEGFQKNRLAYTISKDGGQTWLSNQGYVSRLTPENALQFSPAGNARIIDSAKIEGEWIISVTRFETEYEFPGGTADGQLIRVSDGAILFEQDVAINYYADGLVFDEADSRYIYLSTPKGSTVGGALRILKMASDYKSTTSSSIIFNQNGVTAIRPRTIKNAQKVGSLTFIASREYESYFDFGSSIYSSPDGFLQKGFTTPPEFSSPSVIKVQENTIGSFLTIVAANNNNDPINYSLSGYDSNFFTIDSLTGALKFKSAPNFEAPKDSNTNNLYYFTVIASDGFHSNQQTIGVRVSDLAVE